MTTKMYSYKRERAKRLYPEPAIFNSIDPRRHDSPSILHSIHLRSTHCTLNTRSRSRQPGILRVRERDLRGQRYTRFGSDQSLNLRGEYYFGVWA